jgi:beta-galactosidase
LPAISAAPGNRAGSFVGSATSYGVQAASRKSQSTDDRGTARSALGGLGLGPILARLEIAKRNCTRFYANQHALRPPLDAQPLAIARINWSHPTLLASLLTLALQPAATQASAALPPRERLSFNADWRFQKNEPTNVTARLSYDNIKAWLLPSSAAFIKTNQKPVRPDGNLDGGAYAQPAFDDSTWRKLNIPQDWGIEGPFIAAGQPGSDGGTGRLPYWGIAWYRKHFTLPASDTGRRVSLEIDGAMAYAAVWCNGQFVGGWPYGYSSFSLDLTPFLRPGLENVLAIRLDNPPASSRWYPGGGIYRNVWLVKTAPIHVAHWGTHVTTPEVNKAAATVNLKVTMDNQTTASAGLQVMARIYELNAAGMKASRPVTTSAAVNVQTAANSSATAALSASVPKPKLWGLQKPNRYVAVTTIEQNGAIVDTYGTPFGIRTLKFDPDKGFFLNGEYVKFNGVCNHHDLGALGTAINTRALQRKLEILREMGCNAIRTSHNPPAPELLDLADQMGFLVMDEAFDAWRQPKRRDAKRQPLDYARLFADWHEQDTRMLVRRDRNHPSVILWSIGNEVAEQGQGEDGAAVTRELAGIVHEDDPTRPTTAAQNSARAGSPYAAALDTLGLNYQGSKLPNPQYPSFKQSFPDRFIYGSETASTISSRGEYVFPVVTNVYGVISGGRRGGAGGAPPGQDVTHHQMSSYDLYFPSWATSPDMEFAAQDRFPYVGGEFVWTGFDYLGEPTPWGGRNDPSRSSYFGILDLAGFKKDRFYIYQAHWRSDLPMAHILPHWNWPDRVGQVTPVHIYTSGDEAELFLNGKSLGRKKKEQYQYRLRWDDVQYEPGELKVVAYKNGKKWATDVMKTTGPAAQLALQADRSTINADGQDLSFVTVTIADKNGLLVPRSKNRVRFEISGPGEIVATDNGDATSFESFQAKERNAFNGLCLVIVRATGPGSIVLKATSPNLRSAEWTIKGKAR